MTKEELLNYIKKCEEDIEEAEYIISIVEEKLHSLHSRLEDSEELKDDLGKIK